MLHKKLFAALAILLGMAVSFGAYAQNITVTGTVVDELGPLAGVAVQSSVANAVTDVDGKFTIKAPSNGELKVSCLGYVTQIVPINGRSQITITLVEDSVMLEEAVAVGYGTQKKTNLTGAVSVIKADKIQDRADRELRRFLRF